MTLARTLAGGVIGSLALAAMLSVSEEQSAKRPGATAPEQQVLKVLREIQDAAEALDAEKVFSYVVQNDKGALAQNGQLFLTRDEALESTKRGLQALQKVRYQFDPQHITMLSPSIALAVGAGESSATLRDGRTFTTPFAQSVILVLTNGEWKVLHAHRSLQPGK